MGKKHYFTVGLFNAGSLGTRHDEFINAFSEQKLDLLAINETWLKEGEDIRAPVLPGYRIRHTPRSLSVRSGRGGGVGFYIRRGVSVQPCPHPSEAPVEQMWLRLKIGTCKVIIGTAYRPPWQDVNIFLDSLTDSITSFSEFDHIILLGDFNINLNLSNESKAIKLGYFFHHTSLEQLVSEPTHFTEHSETLIDLICSDVAARKISVSHIPELGSHAVITAEFLFKVSRPKPQRVSYRPFTDIQPELFNSDLEAINWKCISEMDNVNSMVECFNYFVIALFDLHAPVKSGVFRERLPPWYTDTIKDMFRIRNNSHKKYKKTKLERDKKIYKELKSTVKQALHNEKIAYFNNNINSQLNKPKKLWQNLRSTVLPKINNNLDLPKSCSDPDVLNYHFLNLPGNDSVTISDLTYFEFHRFGTSTFHLQPVGEDTIATILKSFTSDAYGIDQISRCMINLTLPHSLDAITAIVNSSITTGIFPDMWKIAMIKPIPKTANPTQEQDLRPINILPFLSKILERVVSDQMTKYLESKHILPKLQSGFRKGHSTATALLNVMDNILSAQDSGQGTLLVLLDFSRAFETLNSALLLSKLSYYGFHCDTVRWFESYLHMRYQYVELKSEDGQQISSSCLPVTRGVPQGSILGPLLFILYSTDLTKCIRHCNLVV